MKLSVRAVTVAIIHSFTAVLEAQGG